MSVIKDVVLTIGPAFLAYLASRSHTRTQIRAHKFATDSNALIELIESVEKKALRCLMASSDKKDLDLLAIEIVAEVGNIARRINSYKQSSEVTSEHKHALTKMLINYRRALTGDQWSNIHNLPLSRDDSLITLIRVATNDLAAAVSAAHGG